MTGIKLNILGLLVFVSCFLLGFILDIIHGTGGSGRIFTAVVIITIILSLILLIGGTFSAVSSFNINKIFLYFFIILLSPLQLLICYGMSVIIALYVIAPIMGRLGYYVTMP